MLQVLAISLLLTLFSTSTVQSIVVDITKFGAKPDGKSDISKALSSAWGKACAATGSSKVIIPKGTYLLGSVNIKGPCKGPIQLQVQGTLKAPTDPNAFKGDSWISFTSIDRFTLSGGGTFDGQGELAWNKNECSKNPNCKLLPISLRFDFITNSVVGGVTSLDSKYFHVNVLGCENLTFQRFTVIAPKMSANTDGIHIGRSKGINITDSNIGTGDDCISLGDGSEQIWITRVTCGPGHGISVGSLGKYENEEIVSGIFVRNCTLSNTDNGLRIKTWPARYGGRASNMHFEDVIMNNVRNPVLIDQIYCPWNQCVPKAPSKVKISNVSFKNIRGSSSTPVAVQLNCSSGIPCQNVKLSNIHLTYNGSEGLAKSSCANVIPKITGCQ